MVQPRVARIAFAVVALVAAFALVFQLVLVVLGYAALIPEEAPPTGIAVLRFFAYFTIQSNIAVLVACAGLALDPGRDGPVWRVLRADAIIGIAVTGLVAATLLAPLMDLHGGPAVADKLLHVVVPILAVVSWLIWGPRPRASLQTVLVALGWPIVWTIITLIVGAITDWYPYPFLNVGRIGAGPVTLYCLAITVIFLVLGALVLLVDRKLPRAPVSS